MSGWANSGSTPLPLSRITIGFLDDIGYSVDYSKTDSYTPPSSLVGVFEQNNSNSGSSGGPLINKSGCVVGVNTLAGRADKGAVNINFAISGQTAQRFIDKYDPDNPPSIHQEIQSVAVNNRVREREYSYNNSRQIIVNGVTDTGQFIISGIDHDDSLYIQNNDGQSAWNINLGFK